MLQSHNSLFCSARVDKGEYATFLALRQRKDNIFNKRILEKNDLSHYFRDASIQEKLLNVANRKHNYSRFIMDASSRRGQASFAPLLTELAVLHTRLWRVGQFLRIKFLDGTGEAHSYFQAAVGSWLPHIDLRVQYVTSGEAEVRVSFTKLGSWSTIGTDALTNTNQDEPTMNLDLRDMPPGSSRFQATVLHEFGHCLGCVHEHQSPAAGIQWNALLIYNELYRQYGWDRPQVDLNFFQQANASEVTNSVYDPTSIMHYPFPPEFTLNGQGSPYNTALSPLDISFISQCYQADTAHQLLLS